jgi:hypothetical protein
MNGIISTKGLTSGGVVCQNPGVFMVKITATAKTIIIDNPNMIP